MKALSYLIVFLLAGTASFAQNNDDVYYQPSSGSAQAQAQDQYYNSNSSNNNSPNNNNNSYQSGRNTYGNNPNAYTHRNDYQQDSTTSRAYRDSSGNTNITNNYYSNQYQDNYDYYYTARVRRWYNPVYGFGYYGGIYTDRYWYDGDPFYYGTSIYYGSPWFGPSWTWGCYSPYFGFGYGFGYGLGFGYYGGFYRPWYGGYYGGPYVGGVGIYEGGYGYGSSYYGPRNRATTVSNNSTTIVNNVNKTSSTGTIYGAGKTAVATSPAATNTTTTSRYPGNVANSNIAPKTTATNVAGASSFNSPNGRVSNASNGFNPNSGVMSRAATNNFARGAQPAPSSYTANINRVGAQPNNNPSAVRPNPNVGSPSNNYANRFNHAPSNFVNPGSFNRAAPSNNFNPPSNMGYGRSNNYAPQPSQSNGNRNMGSSPQQRGGWNASPRGNNQPNNVQRGGGNFNRGGGNMSAPRQSFSAPHGGGGFSAPHGGGGSAPHTSGGGSHSSGGGGRHR